MDDKVPYSHFTLTTIDCPAVKPQMGETWICRLLSGSISLDFNFKPHNISAKDKPVLFMAGSGWHFALKSATDNAIMQVTSISSDYMSSIYPFLGARANISLESPHLITSVLMPDAIAEMFDRCYSLLYRTIEASDRLKESERMIMHLLIDTCLLIHNGIDAIKTKRDIHEGTSRSYHLMATLFEILQEPESLKHHDAEYFADRLNITPRYFYDVCIKETGMSSKQLVDDVIINELKHHLIGSDKSFQEISYLFGFNDQAAFTQYFKRNTGMTPTGFRKKHK